MCLKLEKMLQHCMLVVQICSLLCLTGNALLEKKNLFNAKYLQSLQLAEYSFTSFKFKYSNKCNIKD